MNLLAQIQAGAAFGVLALLLLAETVHPFFGALRGRARAAHAGRNLVLGFINSVLVAAVFAGLWVAAAGWGAQRGVGLLHALERAAGLPAWMHAVLAVLLLDMWTYAWHRMNHRIPFLWRFHRVHHADAEMDVTTASRFHAGEIVLSSLLRVPLLVGLGIHAWELVLYEIAMFAVVQFHHADLALPARVDRVLGAVIVTPAMHKVHHSHLPPETDSNYSALFSWWDRLFGSFRRRARLGEIRFGLGPVADAASRSLPEMLVLPLAPVAPRPDEKTGR